jgi:hypothetical protein
VPVRVMQQCFYTTKTRGRHSAAAAATGAAAVTDRLTSPSSDNDCHTLCPMALAERSGSGAHAVRGQVPEHYLRRRFGSCEQRHVGDVTETPQRR